MGILVAMPLIKQVGATFKKAEQQRPQVERNWR